jgi:hypothetical protein
MVRVLDVDTQAAIRDRTGLRPRNFIVITAKDRDDGDPSIRCFWDEAETVAANVLDESGDLVSRNFVGDGSIVRVDPIPMRIGLEVRTIEIVLSAIHPEVENLIRGDEPRGAKVEIYRGLLSLSTGLLVSAPRIRFLGKINEAPIQTAAAGGASTATLRVVSHTRELTRTNSARKSDAQQKLRSGDRFRRYSGKAGQWITDIWWGEAKPR